MCSEGRKSTEIYAFVEETLEERRERTMYTNVCKHCHQVFRSKIRTCCCKDCRDKDEDQLDDIVEYLHRFPNSNADFRGTWYPSVCDLEIYGRRLVV